MKTFLKITLMATAFVAVVPLPAFAQAAPAAAASTGIRVAGIGVADLEAVVSNADANKTAASQRPTTYKPQIDAYQARTTVIQAQLKPLVDKFTRDRAAPNANQAALQTQAAAIQQIQEGAQRELNEIIKPVAYSEAYVNEQIEEKLNQAVKNAMTTAKVTILLKPDAILATENSYNLSPAILAELNKLIPSASLVPPTGWEPRQVRDARAQQQAQAGGAPAAAPASATPASSGR